MVYEDLRQWRDICEFLNSRKWKFIDSGIEIARGFTLLQPESKPHREELWSKYMLQLCKFGPHPSTFFSYRARKESSDDWGWRLLPGWERKIDFLEQIVLFSRNADDLPQPWRHEVWETFLKKREKELQHEQLMEDWRRRNQEELERYARVHKEKEQNLKSGDCPARFHCQSMSGALVAGDCVNFRSCKELLRGL